MNRRTILLGTAALAVAPLAARNAARAAGMGPVRIAYVEWSDAVVATNILATVLKGMGHEVTMTPRCGRPWHPAMPIAWSPPGCPAPTPPTTAN